MKDEWAKLLDVGNLKKFFPLILLMVWAYFYIDFNKLFPDAKHYTGWKYDFFFVLYWVYALSLAYTIVELAFSDNGIFSIFSHPALGFPGKLPNVYYSLSLNQLEVIEKMHKSKGFSIIESSNEDCKILKSLFIIKLVTSTEAFCCWKLPSLTEQHMPNILDLKAKKAASDV